nr:pyridoxal-phosphate dependent enzyme [Phytoactinopolyspora limicola]
MRLGALPRVKLAHLPTPLTACPRLYEATGARVSIKRDDCTGLAFGGNKVRQLEFVLGDAIASGADCLIQGSASQSNHSRQLAAAGARLGLDVFLLPKQDERSTPVQGNQLVSHLLGATILPIGASESSTERKRQLADSLRAHGRTPYVVGMGEDRALALAALAYVEALLEIVEASNDTPPDVIVTTSQGSTQAGLQLGCHLLNLPTKVIGINPMPPDHEAYISPAGIADLTRSAGALLGLPCTLTETDIVNSTEYVGQGYGIPTTAGLAAIKLLASTEGILLDPVYSGKGFAGLLDHHRTHATSPDARLVFVHTGGLPAIFSYASDLINDEQG